VGPTNSRFSRLISNMDVSGLAAVMFVLVFVFIFLTATPHRSVAVDLPKVGHPLSVPGANREDAKVYIRAGARARYQAVREVLDAVRFSGMEKVAFLAYQRRAPLSSLQEPR
jgi:biopolymer transport protein ExbD